MEIIKYRQLVDTAEFFKFLETESLEATQPASVNLWSANWETNAHTLPYLLTKTDRFNGSNGEFFILRDGDKFVACGGVYISEFSTDVAIAGARTWVNKEYRHLALNKDYLLVEYKAWAVDNKLKTIALSFNDYNKNMIQIFKRGRLGERVGRIAGRKPKHLFYSGLHEVNFPVTIQHTPQWVIYEKLDSDFNFNWGVLK